MNALIMSHLLCALSFSMLHGLQGRCQSKKGATEHFTSHSC